MNKTQRNPVLPTKSIRIFHGISTDINVWIGTKHFDGTKIECILHLGDWLPCLTLMSMISGGALIFVCSGNQHLFMQNNVCISVWLYDSLVTRQTMYYGTQGWPQLKTHSKKKNQQKRTDTDRTHTTRTLCAHSLFSPLAAVKTERRGSVSDTVVMFLFLYAWSANGFRTPSGNSNEYMDRQSWFVQHWLWIPELVTSVTS